MVLSSQIDVLLFIELWLNAGTICYYVEKLTSSADITL